MSCFQFIYSGPIIVNWRRQNIHFQGTNNVDIISHLALWQRRDNVFVFAGDPNYLTEGNGNECSTQSKSYATKLWKFVQRKYLFNNIILVFNKSHPTALPNMYSRKMFACSMRSFLNQRCPISIQCDNVYTLYYIIYSKNWHIFSADNYLFNKFPCESI